MLCRKRICYYQHFYLSLNHFIVSFNHWLRLVFGTHPRSFLALFMLRHIFLTSPLFSSLYLGLISDFRRYFISLNNSFMLVAFSVPILKNFSFGLFSNPKITA